MANISVEPNIVTYPFSGATQQVAVVYGVPSSQVCAVTTSDNWITVTTASSSSTESSTNIVYNVAVAPNGGAYRIGSVVFKCVDSSSHTTSNMYIIRQGTGDVDYRSIWEDTYFTISGINIYNYSMAYNGNIVYSGKAYKAPGSSTIDINVMTICKDYIHQSIEDFRELDDDVVANDGAYGIWTLCDEFGVGIMNWVVLYNYTNDWTGQTSYMMTEPINGHVDPRMLFFVTKYRTDSNVSVNPATLSFSSAATSDSVSVTATAPWSATTSSDWISVSPQTGENSTVSISVSQSSLWSQRTGQVIFDTGDATASVDVTQGGIPMNDYFSVKALGSGTLSWDGGTLISTPISSLEYKKNDGSWVTSSDSGGSVSMVENDVVYFRAPYTKPLSMTTPTTFSSTMNVSISGNILSLYYNTGFSAATSVEGKMDYLFRDWTGLIDASNLLIPSLTAKYNGYLIEQAAKRMFSGCSNLIAGPQFAPNISVLSSGCSQMFYGCTSLRTMPVFSPDSIGLQGCYQMFYGCTSLQTVDFITNSIGEEGCREMFTNCTGLTSATIDAYFGNYSCTDIFSGCTLLNEVNCLIKGYSGSPFDGWLVDTSSSGTIYTYENYIQFLRNYGYVPYNWTVIAYQG